MGAWMHGTKPCQNFCPCHRAFRHWLFVQPLSRPVTRKAACCPTRCPCWGLCGQSGGTLLGIAAPSLVPCFIHQGRVVVTGARPDVGRGHALRHGGARHQNGWNAGKLRTAFLGMFRPNWATLRPSVKCPCGGTATPGRWAGYGMGFFTAQRRPQSGYFLCWRALHAHHDGAEYCACISAIEPLDVLTDRRPHTGTPDRTPGLLRLGSGQGVAVRVSCALFVKWLFKGLLRSHNQSVATGCNQAFLGETMPPRCYEKASMALAFS